MLAARSRARAVTSSLIDLVPWPITRALLPARARTNSGGAAAPTGPLSCTIARSGTQPPASSQTGQSLLTRLPTTDGGNATPVARRREFPIRTRAPSAPSAQPADVSSRSGATSTPPHWSSPTLATHGYDDHFTRQPSEMAPAGGTRSDANAATANNSVRQARGPMAHPNRLRRIAQRRAEPANRARAEPAPIAPNVQATSPPSPAPVRQRARGLCRRRARLERPTDAPLGRTPVASGA